MLAVQSSLQKYFRFGPTQIKSISLASHPTEGRIAIVTDAGWIPVDLAVTTLVCFTNFAREAAGAAGTRLSLRPLFFERRNSFVHTPGASRRGIADLWLNWSDVIARSAANEAIHDCRRGGILDCFAEPVIGRAFARPVGSQ